MYREPDRSKLFLQSATQRRSLVFASHRPLSSSSTTFSSSALLSARWFFHNRRTALLCLTWAWKSRVSEVKFELTSQKERWGKCLPVPPIRAGAFAVTLASHPSLPFATSKSANFETKVRCASHARRTLVRQLHQRPSGKKKNFAATRMGTPAGGSTTHHRNVLNGHQ